MEKRFHLDMVQIYERAKKECGYNATRFLQMVADRGGLQTARDLVVKNTPTDGFVVLWQCGRLDLSVEALILKSEYASLFTDVEKDTARQRLLEYNYKV